MISHHDHHRHSAYLLAHVDAAGFSQSQLRRIGDLVLGQRGGLRKMEAALQDASFALHLLCLRLARDRLPRARRPGAGAIALGVDGGMPTIALRRRPGPKPIRAPSTCCATRSTRGRRPAGAELAPVG